MQHRFANVDGVVYVPNAVSVEPQTMPGVGVAQQGLARPGVHAALFASVQDEAGQVPFVHVPLQTEPQLPQLAGSVRVSTHVFVPAQ
jgi:hypothetical protein